jgi:hypothetical protein
MQRTKTGIASTVLLLALVCGGPWTKRDSLIGAAPSGLSKLPAGTAEGNKEVKKAPALSPVGILHDFGKLPRGTLARHAFRIVNTSDVPLHITKVYRKGGCAGGAVSARVSRTQIAPGEEGKVEVTLETARFRGRRTFGVVLETDNGSPMVTVFYVSADAQDDPTR